MAAVSYDLRVTAKTPGHPSVLALTNVTTAAAGKLLERLKTHELLAGFEITEHQYRVTPENVDGGRNEQNLEVLLAVLERRERLAAETAAADA